ncbi:AIPR family protein [Acutalibacter sp. LFL-21]|uniref:AIPR family protein n=1 Tax=Acutalibacter sp. LFL-21 TaxID=2983399 RepID=UPI0021D649DE|nr:AIPR family protein [Acutalibacter sp. LFL-21]MCU7653524.1 AIPR family protein [Acutalibacter sp. LFL-21]
MKLATNSQRILEELFQQDFADNVVYTDQSQYFEFFSTKNILKNVELSDEEIESGVLGSGNDGGCDSIYILFNGTYVTEDILESISVGKESAIELMVVQAKRETSFGEDAIMKWKTTASNLLEIGIDDSRYQARYNEDVLNAFALFRNLYVKLLRYTPKINISFHYASFANEVHPNVEAQANELIKIVESLYPSPKTTVLVKFWGAEKLLRAAQSQPEHKLNLPLAETPINIGTHQDYVALVNLEKYYRFIVSEDGTLRKYIFEANVRDYQGHNAVNQDIQNTLVDSTGEDFWWLNNGITLLADEAILATSKELVLTEPAVVNGLQTSNEIYHFFQAHPEKTENEKRNVLVRIIVPESEDSRDRIILATNNQTNILKSSLRANDPIHLQIELYLKRRGLYYDRRKNYYRNQGKKSAEIVSVSFLSQCMISLILHRPDSARARPSTLLTKDEIYEALYIKNQDLDVFYNAARLGKTVERCLKQSSTYSQAQTNDILFYVLYYAVAKDINRSNITSNDIKSLDVSAYTDEYILGISKTVFAKYESLGGDSKVAKGTELIKALEETFR